MVAEHHDQRLVGGVIEVDGAADFGQPHGDPVGLENGDDVDSPGPSPTLVIGAYG
jgi:hypothetical protein